MIDEWEENAGLVFGFQCTLCDNMLGYGDLPEECAQSHDQFVKEITKLAQVRGWRKIARLNTCVLNALI